MLYDNIKSKIEALMKPEIFKELSPAEVQYVAAAYKLIVNNRTISQIQMDVILDLYSKYIKKSPYQVF